ncbi:tripartite tricarboxylate transporter substrate binding protein [Dankookia rubra]|uniref:Tripartite tricarboxylate transporter substrate binding protein n=1 Tax=Dankookia rubra TaxID=1442381 RepID=A0A4R5Q8S4_9PROT|nr:tripartite tricarboxylate transporter substrate binding protein [Dankookia rubra]TDH59360.1 tripartite tricarboxylate transporter substrate binding protein [Dankookia rubra]
MQHPIGRRALGGLAAGMLAPRAGAQEAWPTRPIRLVVAFTAGSEPDILARALAPVLQAQLGQSVVVDNRIGAASVVAAEHVSQQRPDGYTLLLTSSSTFCVTPHLFANLPFRVEQFQPLTLLMRGQLALFCDPKLPVRTVAELVAYARALPQPMPYAANVGLVAHLSGERLKQATGIELLDVSYRGTPAAQQMMMRSDVAMTFDGVASYIGLVRNGDIRALAVTGDHRIAALPEVPTFAEAGFPDIAQPYWYGLFAPAGVPDPVVRKLVAATHVALAEARLGDQMVAQGAELRGNQPAEFSAMVAAERGRWGELIRSIGLRLG